MLHVQRRGRGVGELFDEMKTIIFLMVMLFCLPCSGQQAIPADELVKMRALMPQIEDENYGGLNEKLHSPDSFIYTSESLGSLYQMGFEGRQRNQGGIGFADAKLNIAHVFFPQDQPESKRADGSGGNANVHFPWPLIPGAVHLSRNEFDDSYTGDASPGVVPGGVDHFKVMWLPPGWPVVWWRMKYQDAFDPRNTDTVVNWSFPVGTVFFEVMTLTGPDGNYYTFEVRCRIRESDRWVVDRFVPYPTAKDLVHTLGDQQSRFVSFLKNRDTAIQYRLTSRDRGSRRFGTPGRIFDVRAQQDTLPPLPVALVKTLLTDRTFYSSLGKQWKPGCNAPTTEAEFHIVPPKYIGAFLGNDGAGCANCHADGLLPARAADAEIGWYGYIRGNRVKRKRGGSILSFHPQEPSASIGSREAQKFVPNKALTAAGMLAKFDEAKHLASMYTRLDTN